MQFTRSSRSVDKCPLTDRRLSTLRLFALREFQVSTEKLSNRFPEAVDLLTRISWRSTVRILLRLFHLLFIHKLLELWILRHLSSLTMDGPKLLRDFGTLISSLSCMCEALRLVHLALIRRLLILCTVIQRPLSLLLLSF
jgi:hypothetical protein